jgi:putative ABC transport system substrate-binding protein
MNQLRLPVVAVRAQHGDRVRRVGVLYFVSINETHGRDAVFKDELKRLGWNEGRDVTIDARFAGGDPESFRAYAAELVSLMPDVIMTQSRPSTKAVQAQTKSIPIVRPVSTQRDPNVAASKMCPR